MERKVVKLSASWVLWVVLVPFGCADSPSPARSAEPGPAPVITSSSDNPTIGYLMTRTHRIELRYGDGRPFFTVSTKDGSLVASDLSEAAFAAQFPALHRVFKAAYAAPRSTWAGIDEPPQ